ncbi:YihA family ribosome biogenesis GTP-binding protein [Candidatus Uhrbacteria bacterium]|nr:YihA family ribosome biogenesis GTP-binding protein [Candidatus Uhrbacteria bacterium]
MMIRSARFIKGIRGTDDIVTDGRKQIAFVGRSNVGKSSLLNALTLQNELARVGKKPGKTTEINFYLINNEFYFVDLPGYGYARTSHDEREKIRKMILWYLTRSGVESLTVALAIDSVVGLTGFDREMIQVLTAGGIPFVVIANKIDKLKPVQWQLSALQNEIPEAEIIPFSTKTKQGVDALLERLYKKNPKVNPRIPNNS